MIRCSTVKPSRQVIEEQAAKRHLLIALDEFKPLPKSHDELIEKYREYFENQKVEVFSNLLFRMGEADFREFIAETVLESGKYFRDEDGQIKIKA